MRLLFFATTVNYIDRQVLGILKTNLKHDLHWTEDDYANIIFWFQVAYAAGNLAAGWLMDKIGVRLGMTISVTLWSVAAMAHAAARSVFGFSAARFGLGLAEGGNFPGAIKAVSAWFPKKERALATGIFNSGANIGALITPPLVIWITGAWGWRATFLVTGALGFFWLLLWYPIYNIPQLHPRVSPAERDYILSDPPDPAAKVPWLTLLGHRQTWAFCTGMFLSAPVWWFYLYWIPDFFAERYGLNLKELGWPLIIIYQMTVVGSIGGGWISGALLKSGRSLNFARKTAFLIFALCVVPVCVAPYNLQVDGGFPDRAGGGGASGVRGQPVHAGQRYGAAQGGQFRGGDRRDGRGDRRDAGGQDHRQGPDALPWRLPGALRGRLGDVSGRPGDHSPAGAAHGADAAGGNTECGLINADRRRKRGRPGPQLPKVNIDRQPNHARIQNRQDAKNAKRFRERTL